MMIDEAIRHYEQVAENQIKCADRIDELHCDSTTTRYMAEHHRQLVELLKELKELRQEHTCRECKYSSYGFSDHPCSVCRRGYYPRYSMTDYYETEENADKEGSDSRCHIV